MTLYNPLIQYSPFIIQYSPLIFVIVQHLQQNILKSSDHISHIFIIMVIVL